MKTKVYLLVIIIVYLLSGCGGVQNDGVLKYGGQYYPEEFLLKGHDFFKETGVLVEHTLFSSGSENNEALVSRNVDVNCGSDSKTVALAGAMGDDVVIIGTVQKGNRYSTVVRPESEYLDWSDLKGQVVGTRFGSGAEFVLRKYFDSRDDLSWEDFKWVNIKTEDMIAALDNGKIEAFTVWSPTGEVAESMGIGRLLRSFGDVALTPVSLHTRRDVIENKRDLLVKFIAGHLKKAEMIRMEPEKAAAYAAEAATERGMEISEDAFALIFQRIDFSIEFDEGLVKELEATAGFLKDQGKIESIPVFHTDTTILRDAKALLDR